MKPATRFIAALLIVPIFGAPVRAEPPAFSIHLADGQTVRGLLTGIEPNWSLTLGGDRPRRVPADEVIAARRTEILLPDPPAAEQVIFANGDRLAAKVLQLTGERLRLGTGPEGEREIMAPLSAVAAIWIAAPDRTENSEEMLRGIRASKRKRDLLFLKNGDAVEGLLTRLDRSGKVSMTVGNQDHQVDFAQVSALALSTELIRSAKPSKLFARLVLTDGSRLVVPSARIDRDLIRAKTVNGVELAFPLDWLVSVSMCQGRTVYLSDLKPKSYRCVPFLGTRPWALVSDANARGEPIRVGGNTYDRGLGVHSACRLSYALDGKYRAFECWVGLDDKLGRTGSVRASVLVDGKLRTTAADGELTHANGPRFLRIDVRGATELAVDVGFGNHADVEDFVDFADARLIK